MKKILLASAAICTLGSAAYAEVDITGYGRFGLKYNDADGGHANTQVEMRLRFNFDVTVESAGGVQFGARMRGQYDENNTGTRFNAANFNVKYGGLTVEVGNVNTAYDSAELMYDSEMGLTDSSFGDPGGDFLAYASSPYGDDEAARVGAYASYTVGGFTGKVSYVTLDQQSIDLPDGVDDEIGVAADYKFGDFTVSGAAVFNAGGVADEDLYFLGAAYEIAAMDANIGLLYFDQTDANVQGGTTWTLYGNKKFGDWTAKAYIATNNADGNDSDIAGGLGFAYDMGNKTSLLGAIHVGYEDNTFADLGIKFAF